MKLMMKRLLKSKPFVATIEMIAYLGMWAIIVIACGWAYYTAVM